MSPTIAPDFYGFNLEKAAVEVLQELQVILAFEHNETHGEALESTIVWYERMKRRAGTLHFIPPESQHHWSSYSRSLTLAPGKPLTSGGEREQVRVEGAPARQLLCDSQELRQLAETDSLEDIIRLRAEYQFRLADGWNVELGS